LTSPSSDASREPTGENPGPSVGCAPGDGGQAFLGVLAKGVDAAQWDIERLNAKAKSTLGTGAITLSVLTAGLVGLGRLLDGDIANLAALAPLPECLLGLLPVLGLAGLVAILASMGLATASLATFKINNLVDSKNFTKDGGPGSVDNGVLAECSGMSRRIVLGLYRSYIRRIDDLARNSHRAGRLVRASQWLLYAGLACVGTGPVLVLASLAGVPFPT